MKKNLTTGALLLLLIGSASAYQFDSAQDPDYPVLLPTPRNFTFGNQTLLIDPCTLQISTNVTMWPGDVPKFGPHEIQDNVADYMNRWVFYKGMDCASANLSSTTSVSKKIVRIQILILEQNPDLVNPDLFTDDESYTMQIDSENITIVGVHYPGVMRALATVAQLVQYSDSTGRYTYKINFAPYNITDSPRYPYRGFMLDTSRRFYKVETLKQTLDVMAAAKFNVLHWHAVDDDSFPIELTTYPNVTKGGAFEPDQVYTIAMVKEIVSYASKLGLRIIPEFDNPGHTRAIGFDPYFNASIRCFMKDWSYMVPGAYRINGGPPTGVLDPSYEQTYELLQGIFTDFGNIFPDNMIHLGGDEVLQSCFNENPGLQDFMKANNLKDYDDLVVFHMARTRYLLQNLNKDKRALYWSNEDTFYQEYKKGDILVYWGLSANITKLKDIYPDQKYVLAPGDHFYMDCGFGNKYGGNAWCDPFKTWWRMYSFEPSDIINDTSIIGSEITFFSELNGDLNLNVKLWPRGAAIADKLWSDNVPIDLVAITLRQNTFGTFLNNRGIQTSPVTGRWCEKFGDQCFAKNTEVVQKNHHSFFAASE